MDPLSIGVSVFTVAGLAASTSRAFSDLRRLCQTLPGRLDALSNDVADIELVLNQVALVIKKRATDLVLKEQEANIPQLLKQAQSNLDELRAIIQEITDICEHTKVPISRAHVWRRNRPQIQNLQEDIRKVKCSLNIMLGASNSQDMMRIQVDLEAISTMSAQSVHGQDAMQGELQTSLQVDQRTGSVEEILKARSHQLHATQSNQMGQYCRRPSPNRQEPPRVAIGKT